METSTVTKTFLTFGDQVVDQAALTVPPSREFRDAWVLNGTVVEIDMAKARDIHRARIRRERVERFEPFDKEATPLTRKFALGTSLTPQENARLLRAEQGAKKLRDAPADPRIDAATTPEQLAALDLDALIA